MMLTLGMFQFELLTLPFQQMSRKTSWRHGRTPRFGARDASQFLGPGEDKVTLSGALVPGVAGSFGSLDTLRDMAADGEAYALVDGQGRVIGTFVIDSLDESRSTFLVDGQARKGDFTVELTRIAEDDQPALSLLSPAASAGLPIASPVSDALQGRIAGKAPGPVLVRSLVRDHPSVRLPIEALILSYPIPLSLRALAGKLGVNASSPSFAAQLQQLDTLGMVEQVQGDIRLVSGLMPDL
jgi:hypothetical protein